MSLGSRSWTQLGVDAATRQRGELPARQRKREGCGGAQKSAESPDPDAIRRERTRGRIRVGWTGEAAELLVHARQSGGRSQFGSREPKSGVRPRDLEISVLGSATRQIVTAPSLRVGKSSGELARPFWQIYFRALRAIRRVRELLRSRDASL